jgi:hypothetical protein
MRLLANTYLHYVLDLWLECWRRQSATGDMIIVRYADDFIIGFQHEADARRFLGPQCFSPSYCLIADVLARCTWKPASCNPWTRQYQL